MTPGNSRSFDQTDGVSYSGPDCPAAFQSTVTTDSQGSANITISKCQAVGASKFFVVVETSDFSQTFVSPAVTLPSTPTPQCASPGPTPTDAVYVALGDSFQSGEGADGSDPQNYHPANGVVYEPPTGGDDGCHRSPDAYPRLLEQRLGVTTGFWACSGARIADIAGGPGDRGVQSQKSNEDPQIQYVDSSTRLVTIGIGGNDIAFADLVQSCVLQTGHADGKCEGNRSGESRGRPT